jgi:hypothetical protein
VSTCPACNWENDVDVGACAGCGADLGGTGVPVVDLPGPRQPAAEPPPAAPGEWYDAAPGAPPEPEAWSEPDPWSAPSAPSAPPPIVRETSAPVPIRPQARTAPRLVEPNRGDPRSVDVDRTPRTAEASRSSPAPIRDIPVVVAPSASRPTVRGREGDTVADSGPFAVPGRGPGPGARMCPSCGSSVEAGRSFCRCGAQLSRTTAARDDPSATLAQGWSRPVFRRAQRAANGGRRVRYDAALAARVYVLRVAAVLLLLALLGSQAPPWGPGVRGWIEARVEQVLPG